MLNQEIIIKFLIKFFEFFIEDDGNVNSKLGSIKKIL